MFLPTTSSSPANLHFGLNKFFFHFEVCKVLCVIFVYAYHFVRGLFAALAGRGFRTKQVFFLNEVFELIFSIFVNLLTILWPFRSSGRTRFFRATASIVRCPPRSPTQQHTLGYRGTGLTHNVLHGQTTQRLTLCYF